MGQGASQHSGHRARRVWWEAAEAEGAQDGLLGRTQEERSLPARVQTARGDPPPAQEVGCQGEMPA